MASLLTCHQAAVIARQSGVAGDRGASLRALHSSDAHSDGTLCASHSDGPLCASHKSQAPGQEAPSLEASKLQASSVAHPRPQSQVVRQLRTVLGRSQACHSQRLCLLSRTVLDCEGCRNQWRLASYPGLAGRRLVKTKTVIDSKAYHISRQCLQARTVPYSEDCHGQEWHSPELCRSTGNAT